MMLCGHWAWSATKHSTSPKQSIITQPSLWQTSRDLHVANRRLCSRLQHQRCNTVAQARSATRKGVSNSYHEQRARHVRAARDGSIVQYWASWRKWPPFKTVSNLKFLAYLFDGHHLDQHQLEQLCPHIQAALEAQAATFTEDQVSRTLLYLSRLHVVPQATLWNSLVSKLESPAEMSLGSDVITGQTDLAQEQTPQRQLAGQDKPADKESQYRAKMAGVGMLHSLSVLQMLAAGGEASSWPVTSSSGMHLHHLPATRCRNVTKQQHSHRRRQVAPQLQVSSDQHSWGPVPPYLKLPHGSMKTAIAAWQSVNRSSAEVDGIWLPIQQHTIQPSAAQAPASALPPRTAAGAPTRRAETQARRGRAPVKSSSFERSVMAVLTAELDVPVLQEAVLEGSYVSVDLGVVGRGRTWRRGEAVFVAVEAQGPKHFVTKRAAEKRSSVVKRLLRQHAGWYVVAVGHREWRKAGTRGQRRLLRERLSMLPARCWKGGGVGA